MNRRDFLVASAALLSAAAVPAVAIQPARKTFSLKRSGKSMTWTENDLATLNEYYFSADRVCILGENCTYHWMSKGEGSDSLVVNFAGPLARQADIVFDNSKYKDIVLFNGEKHLIYSFERSKKNSCLTLTVSSPSLLNKEFTLTYGRKDISWKEKDFRVPYKPAKVCLSARELQDYHIIEIDFREEFNVAAQKIFNSFSPQKNLTTPLTFGGKRCELISVSSQAEFPTKERPSKYRTSIRFLQKQTH